MYHADKFESGGPLQYRIRGIEDDLGSGTTMNLIINASGDAVVSLRDRNGKEITMEVCTYQGGTQAPGVALLLREFAESLFKLQEDPQFLSRRLAQKLSDGTL